MIHLRNLGLVQYESCFVSMQTFTEQRAADTPDELWIVEHPSVYTLGLSGDTKHLLTATTIPVIKTDRGGQITYHGPGQLVIYLLVDLRRRHLFVRELVKRIEQAVIDTLQIFHIKGKRIKDAPGVYVQLDSASAAHNSFAKIAALGIKVRNQCTYHGVALNVQMDLTPFDSINPCGYPGLQTIDLRTLGVETTLATVAEHLVKNLQTEINRS